MQGSKPKLHILSAAYVVVVLLGITLQTQAQTRGLNRVYDGTEGYVYRLYFVHDYLHLGLCFYIENGV